MRSVFCSVAVGVGLWAAGGAVSAIGQDIVFEGGVAEGPLQLLDTERLTLIGPIQVAPFGPNSTVPMENRSQGLFGASPFVAAQGNSELIVDGAVNGFDADQILSYVATGGGRIELSNTAADIVLVQQNASGFLGSGTEVPRVLISGDAEVEISGTSLRNSSESSLNTTVQISDSAQVVITDSEIVSENGPALEGSSASEIVARDSEVSSLTLSDNAAATFTNVQLGGGNAGPALRNESFGLSTFTGGSIAAQDINGVALEQTERGQVALLEGVEVVGTTVISERGLLLVDGADVRAGQALFEVSDNSILNLAGGLYTALSPDSPVILRADDAANVSISGGVFVTEAQGNPLPQLIAAGSSSIVLIGDYSTFELDGALLPEADASGRFFVTSESGTLAGVLDNGDRFDLSFVRDASASISFLSNAIGLPTEPQAVPSPSAAAAGGLLAAGLLGRRRRRF